MGCAPECRPLSPPEGLDGFLCNAKKARPSEGVWVVALGLKEAGVPADLHAGVLPSDAPLSRGFWPLTT